MAIPTTEDLLNKIFEPASHISFIPTRYPYTYAYDFMRSHFDKVVPNEVKEAILGADADASLLSRAECAGFASKWAEMEGVTKEDIVVPFADAYLAENSIAGYNGIPPRS